MGASETVDRLRVIVVGALLLAAISSAALRPPREDGFPISTYPMFAADRGAVGVVTAASALDDAGASTAIPPRYVGSGETMQALQTLRKTAQAGRRASLLLCRDIASRLRAEGAPEFATARQVIIATSEVNTVAFLAGHAKPRMRTLHAQCSVQTP